jgi:hypothetical protein
MLKRKNKIPDWIGRYASAVKRFTFNHDHDPLSHLPFNAFRFYPLYFDLWLDKICRAIDSLDRKKSGADRLIKALPSFGSLRYIFYTLVNMAGYLDYDKDKARVIFDFFASAMRSVSADENIFNEHENILRTGRQLKPAVHGLKKVSSAEEKKTVAKLIGILAMYNHALYNDFSTEFGYNIEGPYRVAGGCQLLVRHYPKLDSWELWPSLAGMKLSRIVIYSSYKQTRFRMRFVTTHLTTTDNYQDRLAAYSVLVDGRPVSDQSALSALTGELAGMTARIYREQKKLNFEQVKEKFLLQQAYELKGLFDLAGLDWRPDKAFLDRVKNKRLKSWGIIKTGYPADRQEYEDYVGVSYLKKIYG